MLVSYARYNAAIPCHSGSAISFHGNNFTINISQYERGTESEVISAPRGKFRESPRKETTAVSRQSVYTLTPEYINVALHNVGPAFGRNK